MLKKLRFDLARVCEKASGKGYLNRRIWDGLEGPGSLKQAAPKAVITWNDYRAAVSSLQERDKLALDLVVFVDEHFGQQTSLMRLHYSELAPWSIHSLTSLPTGTWAIRTDAAVPWSERLQQASYGRTSILRP
jgi:hypothetical protein